MRAQRQPLQGDIVPIRFTVSDTGIGIPKEKHDQIFDAFSQADSSTTREFGGTGLGLSISTRMIRLMKGEIGLESTPGKGTTFTFTLPFGMGAAPSHGIPAMAYPKMAKKKVLVADDKEINRDLLMHILPQWGLEAISAKSGEEALEVFGKSIEDGAPFSIVLVDQNMPGMNGFEVAEKIRSLAMKEQPAIIILSSAPCLTDAARAKKLGIERILCKPLRRATLYEAIRHALKIPVPSEKPSSPGSEQEEARGLRVLLVEDNRVNQKLALRLLGKMGHHATLATNGREALDLVQKNMFDLILMDIQMPEMDGYTATKAIRERQRQSGVRVPIIAMTANTMSGDREKCLAGGMDDYLSKPILMDELRRTIDRNFSAPLSDRGENARIGKQLAIAAAPNAGIIPPQENQKMASLFS